MRNLKKFLALVLAMMMVFSLMVTVNAADTATDNPYQAAYTTLETYGIVKGTTGSVDNVTGNFTRAQMALIAYKIATGDVTEKYTKEYAEYAYREFTDLPANFWAAGAIGFCQNQGFVVGSNGKFRPNDLVDGFQVAALMLRLLGYDKYDEFIGPNWKMYAGSFAAKSGINKGLKSDVNLSDTATRGVAIQMACAAATQASRVVPLLNDYFPLLDSLSEESKPVKLIQQGPSRVSFGDWGDPTETYQITYTWPISKVTQNVAIPYTLLKEYTNAVKQCDMTDDITGGEDFYAIVFTNGNIGTWNGDNSSYYKNIQRLKVEATNTNINDAVGRTGRLTKVYENPTFDPDDINGESLSNPGYVIVRIDDLLAEVTNVTKVNRDLAGHIEKEATMTLHIFDEDTPRTNGDDAVFTRVDVAKGNGEEWEYEVGDFVIVNAFQSNVGDSIDNKNFRIDTDKKDTVGLKDSTEKVYYFNHGKVYNRTETLYAYDPNPETGKDPIKVTTAKAKIKVLCEADSITGAQKVIQNNQSGHNVNGKTYSDDHRYHLDEAGKTTDTYRWFFDHHLKDYLIGSAYVEAAYDYGVVTKMQWVDTENDGEGGARAWIKYTDGTNSDGYIVVTQVKLSPDGDTYDVGNGSDKQAGYVIKDYYRVSEQASDNEFDLEETGDGSDLFCGIVNNHLVAIGKNGDGTYTLEVQAQTTATVQKDQIATKDGAPVDVFFNGGSLYLVRTGEGTKNNPYVFTAKSGRPDATYTGAFVDYKNNTKTGYMSHGLIIGDPATKNTFGLVFMNNDDYDTYVDGSKVNDNARAAAAAKDPVYLLKGTVVDGKEKELWTEDEDVAIAMTSQVAGLFYVEYDGNGYIVGCCQITANGNPSFKENHGVKYIPEGKAFLTKGALSDGLPVDKPGVNVISWIGSTTHVVNEEGYVTVVEALDGAESVNYENTGLYVIDANNDGTAELIYVINDLYDEKSFSDDVALTIRNVENTAPHMSEYRAGSLEKCDGDLLSDVEKKIAELEALYTGLGEDEVASVEDIQNKIDELNEWITEQMEKGLSAKDKQALDKAISDATDEITNLQTAAEDAINAAIAQYLSDIEGLTDSEADQAKIAEYRQALDSTIAKYKGNLADNAALTVGSTTLGKDDLDVVDGEEQSKMDKALDEATQESQDNAEANVDDNAAIKIVADAITAAKKTFAIVKNVPAGDGAATYDVDATEDLENIAAVKENILNAVKTAITTSVNAALTEAGYEMTLDNFKLTVGDIAETVTEEGATGTIEIKVEKDGNENATAQKGTVSYTYAVEEEEEITAWTVILEGDEDFAKTKITDTAGKTLTAATPEDLGLGKFSATYSIPMSEESSIIYLVVSGDNGAEVGEWWSVNETEAVKVTTKTYVPVDLSKLANETTKTLKITSVAKDHDDDDLKFTLHGLKITEDQGTYTLAYDTTNTSASGKDYFVPAGTSIQAAATVYFRKGAGEGAKPDPGASLTASNLTSITATEAGEYWAAYKVTIKNTAEVKYGVVDNAGGTAVNDGQVAVPGTVLTFTTAADNAIWYATTDGKAYKNAPDTGYTMETFDITVDKTNKVTIHQGVTVTVGTDEIKGETDAEGKGKDVYFGKTGVSAFTHVVADKAYGTCVVKLTTGEEMFFATNVKASDTESVANDLILAAAVKLTVESGDTVEYMGQVADIGYQEITKTATDVYLVYGGGISKIKVTVKKAAITDVNDGSSTLEKSQTGDYYWDGKVALITPFKTNADNEMIDITVESDD